MRKLLEIGVLGAPIHNGNLGCQALTYSLISLLEQISQKMKIQFHYNLFEWNPDQTCDQAFCKRLQIEPRKLTSVRLGNYWGILRKMRYYSDNKRMERILRSCVFVIDLTEGDSFTDIYGNKQFKNQVLWKRVVEKSTSLILGSQTYGPFESSSNEKEAAAVLKQAAAVLARDPISKNYVRSISGVSPTLTCDLAFRLPYKSCVDKRNGEPKRIGLNVSGLLVTDKKEGTATEFTLAANYDEFVRRILEYLIAKYYEVHLIGHVAADYAVNKVLKEKYPCLILAPEFDNPMDAKSYISSMDLFIGSRMHATIAALTSNTPVIPVAYSRKFAGVFVNVQYPYMIDLQIDDTKQAVKNVIARMEHYQDIKEATEKSYRIAMDQNDACLKAYEKIIGELLKRK